MQLKSLEVHGFKTFPDRTTLLFEEGITSVVGPNGSGKSNISDAMRWVLGEQSVRILRCGKMEDVVFSGTPKRKAQGYAEVTLQIDNRDRRLDFDNDTVAITRRYYRSGESEYLLNKNTVRLKDINELLMDTGLGRDGYSIIGQGKIDSIVAAKSEDRREIFEEASGISRFRYRKEESERRLNRTEENLVRLRDIFSELEERIGPLGRQAEKAKEFIALDSEKKALEIGLWVHTLNQSAQILSENQARIEAVTHQQGETGRRIEAVEAKAEAAYEETNRLAAEMDRHRETVSALEEQVVRGESERSVLENDIAHNGRQIQRLEGQIEAAAVSERDIQGQIAEKEAEKSEKLLAIEESRQRLDRNSEKLEQLREEMEAVTGELEDAAGRMLARQTKLSEIRVSLSSVSSAETEIRRRNGAVDDALKAARERLVQVDREIRRLAIKDAETREALRQEENSVRGYEMRLESRRKRGDAARQEADRLALDAGEQERRVKVLSDLERNLEGFTQSVKTVMRESRRGLLQGIYGPVTQILKPPRDYAVALETALGGAMQNLVVEHEKDAKAAIQFLKKNRGGRATFLPRNTIRGRRLEGRQELAALSGFVGIASELCQCEEKFQGIRDSLLGRVVVAEDLDAAVGIAKAMNYRFRVVSLDGQVVNAGGSLTGGAQVKNSGLLSRNAEIQRIQEQAKALRAQADAAKMQAEQYLREISQCEGELQGARGEYAGLQELRIKYQGERLRSEGEKAAAQAEERNLITEQGNAAERLEELAAAQREGTETRQRLEEEIRALEACHGELLARRQTLQNRCEDLTETLQEIRLHAYAAQKDRDNLVETIEELTRRQLLSGEAAAQLQQEILELTRRNADLRIRIDQILEKTRETRELGQEKRREIEGMTERRRMLEQVSVSLRQQERELTGDRERIGQELARLQGRSEHLQKEYDEIISKLWEEYELTRREAETMSGEIEDPGKAKRKLTELKNRIKALGAVNVGAVVEYQEVHARYLFLKEQIEDVETAKEALIQLIGDLTKQMREQFVERFAMINEHFKGIFKELFGGGSADLKFSDETDVLNSGIDIRVHPPGKIVTHIESLSGGEKALVAIAIYFAIMRVSPPPFCVLDEIEAALDDVNVTRFAQYLRRMSDETQFIVITHRRGTMEGSDVLYGVTMQEQGISKLLKLRTESEAEALKAVQ